MSVVVCFYISMDTFNDLIDGTEREKDEWIYDMLSNQLYVSCFEYGYESQFRSHLDQHDLLR